MTDSTAKKQTAAERRTQIVDAALRVFSEKGFDAASTKEIAAAAGIKHAGLIYHYFRKKSDLLMAVFETFAPPMQLLAHPEAFLAFPPRIALTRFATVYMELRQMPQYGPFIRVAMRQAMVDPEFAAAFAETGPLRLWRFLSGYLEHHMERGTLRQADPSLTALTFIGPLITTVLMTVALRLPSTTIDADALIAHHVDFFLRGMRTEGIDG